MSAVTALLASFVLARVPPRRIGLAELGARWIAVSLMAIAAAVICLVVPRFLLVFGASAWLSALRSAARNLDVPLVMAATLGACVSLIKTHLLRRGQISRMWIAADLAATVILAVALGALDRLIWQSRTGLDPVGGLASFFDDHRVRAAVLCLPLAASGWIWVTTALAGHPERRRRRLICGLAAATAGLWAGLFVPF